MSTQRDALAALALLLTALALPAAAQDRDKPLIVTGWLSDKEPFDKVRKQSHHKVHEVELKQGELYLIELRSVDFDAFLRLEDAAGKKLIENDDLAPDDLNSRITYLPRQTGKHRLFVSSFPPHQTGEYRLLLQALTPAGKEEGIAGKLTKESPKIQGRYTHVHKVKVEAERWHRIDVESQDIDPFLVLRDEKGQALAEDDDGGDDLNSRLLWPSGPGGTWQLQVLSLQPGVTGAYTLRLGPHQLQGKWMPSEREALVRQARSLNERGVPFTQAGRYPEAQTLSEEALSQLRKLYPRERYPDGHPDLATSLNNLGFLLSAGGQYELAQDCYTQALSMCQKLYPVGKHPDGHPDLARSLNNLGSLLSSQGRYEPAQDYCTQALSMRQKLYSPEQYPNGHPDLATSLSNLGSLFQSRGQHESAQDYYTQALGMRQKLYPVEQYPNGHSDLAASLSNLGSLFQSRGQYESAQDYCTQALDMRQKFYSPKQYPNGHPDLATSLNNLGFLFQSRGQHESAQDYGTQALSMRQKLYPVGKYPNGHPELARSLNNLGSLLQSRGQYESAQDYYTQTLDMRQKLYPVGKFPEGHPDLAASLNNLGGVLAYLGQHEPAQDHFTKALDMCQKLYPAEKYSNGHPHLATSLNNLGSLLHSRGQYELAQDYLTKALEMRQKLYPAGPYADGHPDLAASLNNLGFLLAAWGQYKPALDHFTQALTMQRRLLQRLAAGSQEVDALAYADSFPVTLSGLLSTTAHLDGSDSKAYAATWDAKAPVNRLLTQHHQLLRLRRTTSREVQDSWDRLNAARRELHAILAAPPRDLAARDNGLDELNRRIDALQRAVNKQLPTLQRLQELDNLTPTDLAGKLGPDAVFIDFVRYTRFEQDKHIPGQKGKGLTDRYIAFVLMSGEPPHSQPLSHKGRGKEVVRVELKSAKAIEEAVAAWRAELLRTPFDYPAERKAAAAMADLVWMPLRQHLPTSVKVCYVAPDNALNQIPWAALPGAKKNALLLEEVAVAVVPHGQFLLQRLLDAPKDLPTTDRFLAVGGVHYSPTLKEKDRNYLFASAHELDLLRGLLGKERGLLDLDRDKATVEAVRAALPKARYAHLATHGYFKEKEFEAEQQRIDKRWEEVGKSPEQRFGKIGVAARNPLGFVGLELAGSALGVKAGDERGRFSGEAIVDLSLEGMRLCVLSACRTGEGQIRTRGEGVAHLVRAFHLAGCRDVVASLWSVPDDATAALMGLFYRNLLKEKLPPIEALRQAQLTIYRNPGTIPKLAELAKRRDVDFTESDLPRKVLETPPTNAERTATWRWAAFVLSGVGR